MTVEPEPERSEDGRWIFVGGRRWRAADPAIPPVFRQELVDELMSARRAIGAAKRTVVDSGGHDGSAEATARQRVQHAKVALGERGRPWWEVPTSASIRTRLAATVLALAEHRAPDHTTCPSDAARAVGGENWRSQMDTVRDVVRELAADGTIEVLQKGVVIDAAGTWRGPIRIRRRRD